MSTVPGPVAGIQPGIREPSRAHVVWLLLLVCACAYLPWLGAEPAHSGLETTRIVVARTMERTSEWIVPMEHGEPYLAKPPVGYWMIALGSWPFGGVSVLSARVVSTVAVLLLALALALFAQAELDGRIGLFAGVAVLGSALFLDEGVHAGLETPLALWTTAAILALYHAVWSRGRGLVWAVVAGVALGLATLVKGPVAMLVFVLAAGGLAYGARTRRTRVGLHSALALATCVLVASAWLVPLFLRVDRDAALQRMFDETFQRVYAAGHTNVEPFWYYGPALLATLAPVSFCLPAVFAVRSIWSSLDERRRSLIALSIGWGCVSVLALSFSQGKEARYLIAALPGWALLIGWAWLDARANWLGEYTSFVRGAGRRLAWVLPFALATFASTRSHRLWPWPIAILVLGLAGAVAVHFAARNSRPTLWCVALLLGLVTSRTFWIEALLPAREDAFQVERMGHDLRARLAPGEPLVQLGEYCSYVELYTDSPMRVAVGPEDVAATLRQSPPARYVLARDRLLPERTLPGLKEVASWPLGSSRFSLFQAP